MIIDHIIVHRLQKEREQPSALYLRDVELGANQAADNLLQDLTSVYEKRTGKGYGVFHGDREKYPFSTLLEGYLENGGKDFTALTRDAMALLKKQIDLAAWATGGYMVFILYGDQPAGTAAAERHLIVVMLNDRRGTAIDAETLEIRDIMHLVLDELHLGARIDIPAWRSGSSKKYLSFVKGRKSPNVSRYFRQFVGCDEYVDAVRQNRTLVKAVTDYGKRIDKTAARQVRTTVHAYAVRQQERGEPMDLQDLSREINPGNPEEFHQIANSEEFGLSNSFDPDLQTLRPLGRFHYSDADLTVGFDLQLLGNTVRYDAENDSLTLSPLPEKLRRQLEKAS
jgi:nucleoid-associated protein